MEDFVVFAPLLDLVMTQRCRGISDPLWSVEALHFHQLKVQSTILI